MLNSNIKASILKTLAFYDIFSFPLTSLELWRYLYKFEGDVRLGELELSLKELPGVKSAQGFYFLATRDEKIVLARKTRYQIAEKKFKKVKLVGRFLAVLPFVRLICVCNTAAYGNAKEGSDIDLFIVSKAGRIWMTRAFTLMFLKIFNLRPKKGAEKDKFCLSFFVDEDHLDLEPLALPRNDITFYYWVENFYPVYDYGGYFKKLRQANIWLKEYLPHSMGIEPNLQRVIKLCLVGRLIKKIKEAAGNFDFCENLAKKYQLKVLPQELKDKLNKDVGVTVKDGVIRLISNDSREGDRNEWVVKVNDLIEKL